jgi:Uncharacterized protein involved in propionate catabolism
MTTGSTLAEFILAESPTRGSPALRKASLAAVVDGLASLVGGTREEFGGILHRYAAAHSTSQGASVIASSFTVPVEVAALVNSAAGHSLCFDDTSNAMMGHPTVVVLPAAIAVGESVDATGSDVLDAFAIGIEIAVRTSEVLAPGHYLRGWHATGVCGVLGAAAAAARLLGLDGASSERALGIAATSAAGLRANFGSMAMIFHAGLAARNGVEAALLAQLGMTTAADPFDGTTGYFAMFAGDDEWRSRRNMLARRLGQPWELVDPGLDVKPFPCGSLAHRAIQGILELRAEHGFQGDDVAEIVCRLPELHRAVLVHSEPRRVLDARISLVYPVAVAALRGSCAVDDFSAELLDSPEIQRLISLVRIESLPVHSAPTGAELFAAPAEVSVTLKGGRVVEKRVTDVLASPTYPFTAEQTRAKYDSCTVPALGQSGAARLWDAASALDEAPSIKAIATLMRAP